MKEEKNKNPKKKDNTESKDKKNKKHIIKKIIFKLFGKARWYFVAFVLGVIILLASLYVGSLTPYIFTPKGPGTFSNNYNVDDITRFAVNEDGLAVILSSNTDFGLCGIVDLDTGKQNFAGVSIITSDLFNNKYFYPVNFEITDDGDIYAVKMDILNGRSLIFDKETVVHISKDYRYLDDIYEIDYDVADRMRDSKMSRLNYYDGKVTFAVVEKNGVLLYSIDTDTQAVTVSDLYPTDADGTYTTLAIPVEDSFIFLRSDGNVYKVGFNEPLGDVFYKFDLKTDEKSDNPYFTQAVISGGKLYVSDEYDPSVVYLIENGTAKKVIDLNEVTGKDNKIGFLKSYHSKNEDKDILVICTDNEIYTYSDGELLKKDISLKIKKNFWMHLFDIIVIMVMVSAVGLFINLIIRKKTLLYKQILLTMPVFIVLTVTVAAKIYQYSEKLKQENTINDITIICELATSEFDGYDFSGLFTVDENTGAAYEALCEKLEKFSANNRNKWSQNYMFAIEYRTWDDSSVTLAGDDKIYMPLHTREVAKFKGVDCDTDTVYVDDVITSLFSSHAIDSKISAYGKIADKSGSGNFYLTVSTDYGSFYSERRDIYNRVYLYSLLTIGILTTMLVMSIIYVSRVIKKATKVVRRISEGDLTARIKYKSKDELGEICAQVNEMGQSLEVLFDEKDKTEKFYYKFVPEKFRELLGKENFTDLFLGDAKSSELTVLFCDIRSFSINSEIMTAKENFAFVNVIYGIAGPIIRENNGFVDKYIGDAVMALFENADDAVKCGIELYHKIVLDKSTAEELRISDINIGIGIHSGMAMVGIVGESERLSGTVISDTVNLSSRLESLTKQYKTAMLVSKDTVDRMKDPDALGLRYLGIVQVAGVNEVKAVYEVLDCLDEKEREERTKNSEELREAIRLFHLGRRADAIAELKKISDAGKNDYVTDLYLNYISEMSDDDKGNVFRFVIK